MLSEGRGKLNLHKDKTAFRTLIERIHDRTGYRTDVLEKDYYVVLVLKELADKQNAGLPAYFKGGTALYKALKTLNRFSEDIDLSVDTRNCSRSQNDKRLEQATKKYVALDRDASAGRTNRSEIISIYTYDPVSSFDAGDALQRFGKLKIEATSFTISEPVESLDITPMIYELATESEKKVLSDEYGVSCFDVKTITVERIFIDKLFAAEAYVKRSDDSLKAFEAAKHLYDLAVMIEQPRIRSLVADEKQMGKLLDIRMKEEIDRLDGIPGVKPNEFTFFDTVFDNKSVREAYAVMEKQYVLQPEYRLPFDTAVNKIGEIHDLLMQNKEWANYKMGVELRFKILEKKNEQHNFDESFHHRSDELER